MIHKNTFQIYLILTFDSSAILAILSRGCHLHTIDNHLSYMNTPN